MAAGRTPVIVGVGELLDRPATPAAARHPLELMADALRLAEADAGARLLPELDSLTAVNQASWPCAHAALRVAERVGAGRVGASRARALDTAVGGHQPLRALHQAALAIAAGRAEIAAVVGGEAEHALRQAVRAGALRPWAREPHAPRPPRAGEAQRPEARRLEADRPAHVYPLYENALPAARGTTPAEEQARSAALWAGLSEVAAGRPAAWLRRRFTAAEIAAAGPENRCVAWPYPKLMTANPAVNQGAAVILASLARARALGLDEARLVHLHGGAAAREPDDLLARDGYGRSVALEVVLAEARALAGARPFDLVELYSCFPCVPKLAAAALDLAEGSPVSVTGGLTFFGAPLNNYMTHATVAMVQRLRAAPGALGLLYGQGGYLTAHHALLLSVAPPPMPLAADWDLQARVAARYGAVPPLDQLHRGPARLESFTLLYDRAGRVRHGIALCRTPAGGRIMARVAGDDRATLGALAQFERTPVGDAGIIVEAADGLVEWHHAA